MAEHTIGDQEPSSAAPGATERPAPGAIDQVPVLGFRNYWYPAIESGAVKQKPVHVKMLGDDLVLFRDSATGRVHALADRCPHRGTSLSLGRIYYPGTITCAYHGWTFDTGGKLVAVLSEGPDCPLVGKVAHRRYPVEEFRGMVWAWMGEGAPVPLLDDLPPEIGDTTTALFSEIQVWQANWRVVTENTDGYHAPILHLHSMPRTLYMNWVAWRKTSFVETEDGNGLIFVALESEDEAEFPGLGHWPQIPRWKRIAKKIFRAGTARGRPFTLPDGRPAAITEDIHLPGWRRVRVRLHTVFVEWAVPIDEGATRHFLWDVVTVPEDENAVRALIRKARLMLFRYLVYPTYWRWAYNKRYVGQDQGILESLRPGRERLQANDAGIIAWRRLASRARGRDGD